LPQRRRHLPGYEALERDEVAARLQQLLEAVVTALSQRSATPMVEYAGRIAEQRRQSGIGLRDLRCAFDALQEALWHQLLTQLPVHQRAEQASVDGCLLSEP
jgi:hypothetical protein